MKKAKGKSEDNIRKDSSPAENASDGEKPKGVQPPPSPVNGYQLPPSTWVPGVSGNPGGAPKGTRVSTWLARFGEMNAAQLAKAADDPDLPLNAKIALVQLKKAINESDSVHMAQVGLTAAAWAVDRVEGKAEQSVTLRQAPTPDMSLEDAAKIVKGLPGPDEF